jgi:hypothetical protein
LEGKSGGSKYSTVYHWRTAWDKKGDRGRRRGIDGCGRVQLGLKIEE